MGNTNANPKCACLNPNAVTYICCTYDEREAQTLEGLRWVRPFVDRAIIQYHESMSGEFLAWCQQHQVEVYQEPWHDNLPQYLTTCLNHVGEGWVLRADPDEHYNEVFLKAMPQIIQESHNGLVYNCAKVNCHDIYLPNLGEHKTDFYRLQFFKWYPSVKYIGIGYGTLHEQLVGAPWVPLRLPDECYYTHEKTEEEVYERSWRNFHIGGGGNTLGPDNPIWPEYRQLIEEINPDFLAWQKLLPYIREGHVDFRLKDFLCRYRNRNVIPDADTEIRNCWYWYYVVLHPDENVDQLTQHPDKPPPEAEEYGYIEETYLQVLGRHADQEGKKAYAKLIKEGKLRKEDLPRALMQSPEYRQLITA